MCVSVRLWFQLGHTVAVLQSAPPAVTALVFLFPLFLWIGVTFLLLLVKDHGAVAASAANVVRKAIAVAFSYLYFGRDVTLPVGVGAALVFGSIVWRSVATEHSPKSEVKAVAESDANPSLPDVENMESQPLVVRKTSSGVKSAL